MTLMACSSHSSGRPNVNGHQVDDEDVGMDDEIGAGNVVEL